jgi:beta-glucanase (GH16 family)
MSRKAELSIREATLAILLASTFTADVCRADPPEPPKHSRWVSVGELSDEFNAEALDRTKWNPSIFYYKGRAPSVFAPENTTVRGGYLRLASTLNPDSKDGNWIKAAAAMSVAPIAGPGYYEARISASRLSMSSSFWFQNQKGLEIDVTEAFGASKVHPWLFQFMSMNTHDFRNGWSSDKPTIRHKKLPQPVWKLHTYGVWWKDSRTVWFYLDNKKVAEVNASYDRFVGTMYMFFDTEAFTYFGLPDKKSLLDPTRREMKVDWVRSWKLQNRN